MKSLSQQEKLIYLILENNYCRNEYYKTIVNMFIMKGTKKSTYLEAKKDNVLRRKIISFANNDYTMIQRSKLEGNIRKTRENFINNIEKKIEKHFESKI